MKPSLKEVLELMSPQLRKDLNELCSVYQIGTAPAAPQGIVRCVIHTQLAEWAIAVLERYGAAVDNQVCGSTPLTEEGWAALGDLLNPGEKPPSCS
jgi:hypothetical protein